MKIFLIGLAIIATTCAQSVSTDYLPPTEEYSGAGTNAYETNTLEYEPAHSLSDDGYRYKAVKRYRLRHRRDVSELASYLPPQAASTQDVSYAAPVQVASYEAESVPEVAYSAPQSDESSYESAASEPAHTLAQDGYRYKTVKRYRLRHRRDVNELTSYLPPQAASTPVVSYAAPVQVASYEAESVPEVAYTAPQSFESSYESAASEPAHTLAQDGYRYKTVKRYRLRHRRDVNELTSYLPPQAASTQDVSYAAPVQVASYEAESAPEVAYSAPQSFESSYESAASEPAHTLSQDGYRYKTVKRYRLRHRRDVNELTSYLPPQAASTQDVSYAAPVQVASYEAESAPEVAYSAPQSFESSYESAASEPAHTLAQDGYRYKTVKRYRLRHRRDVNELTSYLPPVNNYNSYESAASVPTYSIAAPQYNYVSQAPSYYSPSVQSYDASYESAASEPAYTQLSSDGYRYKTVKRFRQRHRH